MAAMERSALIAVAVLPLLGCQAHADDHAQQDAINTTVSEIMCAKTDDERTAAISNLASQRENFQAHSEDDHAGQAVEQIKLYRALGRATSAVVCDDDGEEYMRVT